MEQLNQQPVGTGPFSFVAYQPDAVIRYKANPDYWDGKQKIDDLVFAITTDAAVRVQKLKAGECQIMPYPNAADVDSLKADPNLKVMEQEGLNIAYLAYNTTQPPFDKVEGAQGDQHGDQQAGASSTPSSRARHRPRRTRSRRPCGPTTTPIQDDPYDPEAAKKMLADAGVKDLSMKIWAMPVARPYMLNARRAAELMQADLAKVGVNVEIVTYEWAEYLKRSQGEGSRRRGHARLDRRQRRPGQLPRHPARLRRRRRQQPRAVVRRGVRRPGHEGQGDLRPGRSAPSSTSRRRSSSRNRRRGTRSPTRSCSCR